MKKKITLLVFSIFTIISYSQIKPSTATWDGIGDVILSIVTNDLDNTDGIADGAISVNGNTAVSGQGITCTLGGTMQLNDSLLIKTYTYNVNSSYVSFIIQLFNLTDKRVLDSTFVSLAQNNQTPRFTVFNYNALSSDVGDVLEVRYIRTDDGHIARDFVIDNLSINNNFVSLTEPCASTQIPDLTLTNSNAIIESEINLAYKRFSDNYLGTVAPSTSELNTAIDRYNALNIIVSGSSISGNTITSFKEASFLKIFAQHLKIHPSDNTIKEKANNTVWLVGKQFCSGKLALDHAMYSYREFSRPAVLLKNSLDSHVKELFKYTLFNDSRVFQLWRADYGENYQENNGAISTDLIYNGVDVMMAFATWHDTQNERYRYMRAIKRYLNRFCSYTYGTGDGIKIDGSGFHHWNAYDGYMYAFKTVSEVVYYLKDTNFQIDLQNYFVLRDAIYTQFIISNDSGYRALSMSGRNPQSRFVTYSQESVKKLAIAGGAILGLSTADPILSGLYNRIWGIDPDFNYNTITPFSVSNGYFQFNHNHASVFRSNDWIAVNKGFSNNMWGSEIYSNSNRYGRYQSYGALEIIYQSNIEIDNGFDIETWNWNYNPGTTTIVLPWDKLHAEKGRIDELQEKRFSGSLTFKNKNKTALTKTHGTWGVFAMDFQERENSGWGIIHGPNSHNNTFTFKKSTFIFDDIIINLGSNINNNDVTNSTVTTLYQRKDNNDNDIIVNNSIQNGINTYNGATNNWLINNYNTGFYLVEGNDNLSVWNGSQQTPNFNQVNPADYTNNVSGNYAIGYIDHGTNPSNASYEYIIKPRSTPVNILLLDTEIQSGNKPYNVHQKDVDAHIIEHITNKTWGYAIFDDNTIISNSGLLTHIDKSSLIMYQTNPDNTVTIGVTNPDVGFNYRQYTKAIEKKIKITLVGSWEIQDPNPDIAIISSGASTVIEFTTNDGLPLETTLSNMVLGIEDVSQNVFYNLYPNPVDDNFIMIDNLENLPTKYTIRNITGQLILKGKLQTNRIKINRLSSGVYFFKLTNKKGTVLKKIVKK
jgi:hypothetical protein